jgi:hypothetical protein
MASPTPGVATGLGIRTCEFSGGSSGEGPLTWAQQFMWEEIRGSDGDAASFDLFVVVRDPDPIDVDDALSRMAAFVVRHPVLRACLSADLGGPMHQRVVGDGSFAVRVAEGSPAITGKEIRALTPLIDDALPCRGLLVVQDGRVVTVVLRVSHMSIDRWGHGLLRTDLARTMQGQGQSVDEAESRSPLDVTRYEASAAGKSEEDKSLAHAAQVLRAAPPTLFPVPHRTAESERYWLGELRSSSIPRALETLYATRRLMPAGVIIGALAMVAAARAHTDAALVYVTCGNRITPDVQSYPGQMAEEGILVVPVGGHEAGDVMRTASIRSMAAFTRARYEPARRAALLREVEHERGMWIDKLGSALVVNFMADTTATTRGTSPSSTPGPSVFEWTRRTPQEGHLLFVDVSSTADEYIIAMRVDTAVLAPAMAESVARSVEWIITEMVDRPVSLADVARHLETVAEDWSPDPGRGSSTNPAGCEELVRAATSLSDVHVQVETAVDGRDDLVCYLHDPVDAASPEVLHREVMVRVLENPGSVAPARYVVLAEPPGEAQPPAEWIAAARVTRAGSGRG